MKAFAQNINYAHAKLSLEVLEEMIKDLGREKNFLHYNKNPIKACVLLIEFIKKQKHYPMLEIKKQKI